jgi:DNA-binding response OmpR family regulator
VNLHSAALDVLRRAGVDVDYASDLSAASAHLNGQRYAAVLIDANSTSCSSDALGTLVPQSETRPVVVLASSDSTTSYDPGLVSLIIRKPYDVQMVIGVLLACGTDLSARNLVE